MEFIFDGVETGLSLFYVIYSMAGTALGVVTYVLRALGLYTIAKRRGINNPWMSWVPVLDLWVIGCISDQYQYVVKGREKNKRKWLLALSIVMAVLYIAFFVFFGIMAVNAFSGFTTGMTGRQILGELAGAFVGLLASLLPLAGIAIAVSVIRYIAMYDLYTSCAPQNNVLFLLLSIFFSVTEPFFVFFIRKKDEGMPPRRQNQYIPTQETWEQV